MKRIRIPASRRHARGFSLIEMVAAFLVFAIGIGVLMQILATSMHNAKQSSDYTLAALWAQSKLDTVGVGERIEAGHSNGRFDDNYSWDLDIKQVDPSSVEPPPQAAALAGNTGVAGQNPAQGQGQGVSAANAGNGGGIEVSPFDIYQVDLVVSWGGHFAAQPRTAHFSTLRAVNPDPENGVNGPNGVNGANGTNGAKGAAPPMTAGGSRQ